MSDLNPTGFQLVCILRAISADKTKYKQKYYYSNRNKHFIPDVN